MYSAESFYFSKHKADRRCRFVVWLMLASLFFSISAPTLAANSRANHRMDSIEVCSTGGLRHVKVALVDSPSVPQVAPECPICLLLGDAVYLPLSPVIAIHTSEKPAANMVLLEAVFSSLRQFSAGNQCRAPPIPLHFF